MKKLLCLILLFSLWQWRTAHAVSVPTKTNGLFPDTDSLQLKKTSTSPPVATRPLAGKKQTWYERLQQKILQKKLKKRIASGGSEISMTKKVLSVLSLACGALGIILLLFPLSNAIAFAWLGAILTGLIALPRNRSKKHRTMALVGILLGVVGMLLFVLIIAAQI